MLAKEFAPFVVQERTIGLHGVLEDHVRPPVSVLEFHGAPVEVEAHQGWFSTLPGDRHLVGAMGLDKLPDIMLQHYVTHAKMTAGVKQVFVQKEAIGAVQVTSRPGRLG